MALHPPQTADGSARCSFTWLLDPPTTLDQTGQPLPDANMSVQHVIGLRTSAKRVAACSFDDFLARLIREYGRGEIYEWLRAKEAGILYWDVEAKASETTADVLMARSYECLRAFFCDIPDYDPDTYIVAATSHAADKLSVRFYCDRVVATPEAIKNRIKQLRSDRAQFLSGAVDHLVEDTSARRFQVGCPGPGSSRRPLHPSRLRGQGEPTGANYRPADTRGRAPTARPRGAVRCGAAVSEGAFLAFTRVCGRECGRDVFQAFAGVAPRGGFTTEGCMGISWSSLSRESQVSITHATRWRQVAFVAALIKNERQQVLRELTAGFGAISLYIGHRHDERIAAALMSACTEAKRATGVAPHLLVVFVYLGGATFDREHTAHATGFVANLRGSNEVTWFDPNGNRQYAAMPGVRQRVYGLWDLLTDGMHACQEANVLCRPTPPRPFTLRIDATLHGIQWTQARAFKEHGISFHGMCAFMTTHILYQWLLASGEQQVERVQRAIDLDWVQSMSDFARHAIETIDIASATLRVAEQPRGTLPPDVMERLAARVRRTTTSQLGTVRARCGDDLDNAMSARRRRPPPAYNMTVSD